MTQTRSGIDIAHSWADSWKDTGRPNFNNEHIDDTWPEPGSTYVWCNTFLDYDYEWSALLSVDTVANVPGHFEVVDMLAVVEIGGKLNVEWWNEPRLFHDQNSYWLEDARLWFIDLDRGLRHRSAIESSIERYGEEATVIQQQRAKQQRQKRKKARELGLHLPYFDKTDRICRHCGTPIYLADGVDWLDDTDNDTCPTGEVLTLVTQHKPE